MKLIDVQFFKKNATVVLVATVMVLFFVNIYLGISLAGRERTIVLVPTIDNEMSVGTKTVSEDYLLYRGEQIMQLLFNTRHENSDYNVDQILKQVSSSNRPEFARQLEEFTKDIKVKRYFYIFNKDVYEIDTKKLVITFSGYLETFINDRKVKTNHKKYKLSFSNKYGLVKLVSFEEVKDERN